MKDLSGIILAAGLSSRMGRFKPLLPLGGIPMIHHGIHMMKKAGADPIVIITGHHRKELEEALSGIPGLVFLFNPDYSSSQQYDSLRIGLQFLKNSAKRILVTPGDIPLVENSTIQRLLKADGDFIRPLYHEHHGHPVLLNTNIADDLICYTGPGGLKTAVVAANCTITDVPVQDPTISMDADTPIDFEKLIDWYHATHISSFHHSELSKEAISLFSSRSASIFLIVNQNKDTDFIREQAKKLKMHGNRDFHFIGKQEPVWRRLFDDASIVNPENNQPDYKIATTSGYHNVDDFGFSLAESIASNKRNSQTFLFYDDIEMVHTVFHILHVSTDTVI